MHLPAARQTDQVVGSDTHVVLVPALPGPPVPTPIGGHVFSGRITSKTVPRVTIDGLPAATVGSVAMNVPPHVPMPPGTSFVRQPSNRGEVGRGSSSVTIDGNAAARRTDPVRTCNDPTDLDAGSITTGSSSVVIG
jgi:uncharacterized Zn-binding protein involved in type VI secretion